MASTHPEEDHEVEHPTSYLDSLMHLVKGNLGNGVFAMGDAFKNSGMLMGPWLTILIGIIATHCEHLLLSAADRMVEQADGSEHTNYAATVEKCFENGPEKLHKRSVLARKVTNVLICVTHLGFCCVYVVFVAANLKNVVDIYDVKLSIYVHILIIFLPVLFTCWVLNLKYLSPLSTVANLLTLAACLCSMYYCLTDIPPLSSRNNFAHITRLPLFFGTVVYSYLSIGLVLPIRNEMKTPALFSAPYGVLNVGMSIVAITMVIMGFLSYLKYGEDILGSVTLNLNETEILAQVVKLMTCSAILFSFPLQFYVVVQIIFVQFCEKFGPFNRMILTEIIFRSVCVIIIFLMAAVIPFLDLFISLVGSFTGPIILLVIPPVLEFVTHIPKSELNAWLIIKNIFVLAVALIGCFSGTYVSIKEIVNAFRERNVTDA